MDVIVFYAEDELSKKIKKKKKLVKIQYSTPGLSQSYGYAHLMWPLSVI